MENNNIVIKNLKIAGKFGEFTLEELTLPCTKEAWDILGNLTDAASGAAEVVGFENDLSDRDEIKVAEEYETTKEVKEVKAPSSTSTITEKVKGDLKKMAKLKRIRENEYIYKDCATKVSVKIDRDYVTLRVNGQDCGFCVFINNNPPKSSGKDIPYVVETLNLINDVELREYFVNLITKYKGSID